MQTSRSLTQQERTWLVAALTPMASGENMGGGSWVEEKTGKVKPRDKPKDPAFLLSQIDTLVVASRCECGSKDCHTVYFQHYPGYHTGAVAFHQTDDGHTVIVHADDETGMLNELEVI